MEIRNLPLPLIGAEAAPPTANSDVGAPFRTAIRAVSYLGIFLPKCVIFPVARMTRRKLFDAQDQVDRRREDVIGRIENKPRRQLAETPLFPFAGGRRAGLSNMSKSVYYFDITAESVDCMYI
jgi:hypothetical protein